MGFDFENFGAGLLIGWGSAYALYRARRRIASFIQSAEERAQGAQEYAKQNADSRYVNDLTHMAERAHLAGEFLNLTDVLVEPRFVPVTRIKLLDEDDSFRDVFDIVPRVHDYPFLHAAYNIDTLTIDELAVGDRALALLGEPGSGKTTALLAIALHSLNKVQFKPPVDRIQQKLDAEEAKLTEKERATRLKERLTIEQRARERLASEKGATFDGASDEAAAILPLFKRLMPVYVHMADLTLDAPEFGAEADPAEPLVRAVQYRLGRVAARSIPRNLYNRLNRGQVLLLIDGYDDLPEYMRPAYEAWLDAFMAHYRQNFIIVAGPASGYGRLTQLGLTPVFMRSWSDLDAHRAAEHWADMWQKLGGKKRSARPLDQSAVERAKINNRALTPFELTLKIWANYADDVEIPGVEGWLRAYLVRHLPSDMKLDTALAHMAQIAALQLDEGFITRARLESLSIGGAAETPRKDGKSEEDAETGVHGRLLGALRRSGILVRYRGDRYLFRHPHVAAFLASLTLADAMPDELADRAIQPAWSPALGYAALHTTIDAAVQARLNAPPDVLYNAVLDASRWLAYAGADVAWRAPILKYLGNLLTAQSQFPLVRERAAAALVGTRDKNALYILRRAARMANADIRRLACLGMGALGDEEAIADLVPLMNDQAQEVGLAACMALGALRSPQALESMLVALTEGSEKARQAAAIALADMPEEGYPILHEAINDQDMMVRRAAVFGLRRIKTTWALIAIYRAFLEDEQWYVRSAAQVAFQELQFGREHRYTINLPPADALPWLAEWAARRGENVPAGDGAQQMLIKALQEGEPDVRAMSAATMGYLGLTFTTRPLYAALRDRNDAVRVAAHLALAELQHHMGRALPAPA